MSLILDALKKIEREKGAAGEKNVLVLGAVPWGERQARKTSLLIGATLGVLGVFGLGAVATWWLLRPARPTAPAAAAPPATLAPASQPAAIVPPPGPAAVVPPPGPAAPASATTMPATTPFQATPSAAAMATPAASAPAGLPPATPEPASAAPVSTPTSLPAAEDPPAPLAAPATRPAPGAPEVRLTAISRRDGEPVALVNDRLVREGDSFDGIRILRIGDTEVEVEVRGQRRVIRF